LPDEISLTSDGAKAMMQELTEEIEKCNDGKGTPLAYGMFPLSVLISEEHFHRLKTFRRVEDTCRINKAVRLSDLITEHRQKVYDQIEELKNHGDRVTSSELEKARRLANDLENHQDSVKDEFSELLLNIRSDNVDIECLDGFCSKHEETAMAKFHECEEFYQAVQARLRADKPNTQSVVCIIS